LLPVLAQSTAGFRPGTRSPRTRIGRSPGQRKALLIAMFCLMTRSQGSRSSRGHPASGSPSGLGAADYESPEAL